MYYKVINKTYISSYVDIIRNIIKNFQNIFVKFEYSQFVVSNTNIKNRKKSLKKI